MRLNIPMLDSIVPLRTYHRPLNLNHPSLPKLVTAGEERTELHASYGHVVVLGMSFYEDGVEVEGRGDHFINIQKTRLVNSAA